MWRLKVLQLLVLDVGDRWSDCGIFCLPLYNRALTPAIDVKEKNDACATYDMCSTGARGQHGESRVKGLA